MTSKRRTPTQQKDANAITLLNIPQSFKACRVEGYQNPVVDNRSVLCMPVKHCTPLQQPPKKKLDKIKKKLNKHKIPHTIRFVKITTEEL